MLSYRITFSNGSGCELDTRVVRVGADDMDGVRLAVVKWLQEDRVVLDDGDTISISAVK